MVGDGGTLRIRLCGDFGIDAPGVDLPPGVLPGRQGRLVLAYLVCAKGRAVTRDELAELLWPERLPDSRTTSLSAVVSKLRRLLSTTGLDASQILVSSPVGIALELPDDVWVDWEVAQKAMAAAEAAVAEGEPASAIDAATEAVEVADRGFLADPCPWVDIQQDTARDIAVRATIALGEAHLLAGSFSRAVDAGRDAVTRAPGREAAHRLLMRALAASGERAEALRAWERCRAEVIDELGVEPSAETEAIYLQLLDAEAPEATVSDRALPSGVVTFVFTDIVGSSTLWESDGAAMDRALERHDALLADVVASHDGTLLKSRLEGDATVSVFPRATSAVVATLAVADAVAAEPWPDGATPVLRMAVHTGEAVERNGDYFGPTLNRAARLRALARPGQILLSQAAAEVVLDHLPEGVHVTGLGHRDLRGLSRGEHVYALAVGGEMAPDHAGPLLSARPPLPALFDSGEPFVGRDPELARLTEVFATVGSSGPLAVLIAGEPGVGKSRLAAEAAVIAHRAGAVVLTGRCDEELGAPLQPFAECLRQLAPGLDTGRLAGVQGLEELGRLVPGLAGSMALDAPRADPDGERYALFDGFARLLTAVAVETPVVLILDDLHWAGKTTLLLLRHLLRHAGPAPLLVLGTYRDTELARTHPLAATLADLRGDGTAERLTLTGLDPDDVAAYLRAVGREDHDLSTELARVTAGNPFFLIETLRHVVESGGRWDPDELPEGVREATGRRLARLSESANELLHVAAVTGPVFSLELVEEICGRELVDEIADACDAGLVQEDDGRSGRFRFAHALVRQVLLDELVTIRRVRLHRAIAERLEARPASDPDVQLTELARHWFECAAAGEADRAVAACRRAADRAAERLAYAEAAELYGMAVQAGLGASDDERAELLVARVEVLLASGDAVTARPALDELEESAGTSARWTAWHATLSGQLAVVADPERLTGIIVDLREAATVLRDEDDGRGEARAHYVHARALERLGQIGAAEQTLDRALAAARACDDRRLVDVVLASAPEAALWGPSPVTRASGRCLDVVRVLRITGGAPAVEAVALRCQAVLEALRGRLDAARTMVAAARHTFEELGLAPHLLETDVAAGYIELIHAHAVEAEGHLRPALEELRDRGLDGESARAAALLGRALLGQGRVDEAEALGEEAARLSGADLRAGVGWRIILALAAAAREDRPGALRLAREAVELSSATDALLLEVDARMALADVLRTVGEADAATIETRRAVELCERKGATALAELTAQGLPATVRSPGDGDVTGVERPDEQPRHVRENLATASAQRIAAMLNAGDLAGFIEIASASAMRTYDAGTLTPEQTLEYLSGSPEAPLATTLTPLATLGERHVLYHGAFDIADTGRPDQWGDSRMENLTVYRVEDDGAQGPVWLFPVSHVGQAVVALYEQFGEVEAESGPDQERALAAARGVAAWCEANEQVVVDDVLELDLDHVVLVGRDGDETREVVLRFGGWERFTGPFPVRSFEEAVREHGLDPTTTMIKPVATRDELVALAEAESIDQREGPALVGLVVHEIDTQGHSVRSAWFDRGDLDAAYATLDAWYAEHDESASGRRVVGLDLYAHPDRVAFDAYFAPELVVEDHRVVGHVSTSSRGAFFDLVAGLSIGMVDVRLRYRHVLGCDRGVLAVVDQQGAVTIDGSGEPAPYEISVVSVEELDDDGRVVRVDLYDEDQLVDAFARYDDLLAIDAAPTRPPGWERFERLQPPGADQLAVSLVPDVQIEDHRTLVGVSADGIDDVLARWSQMQRDTSLQVSSELLATRGDHFALSEIHLRGTWGLSGDVEQSFLSLAELDDEVKTVRLAFFDAEERERAVAALDEWYLTTRELSWESMLSTTSNYGANVLALTWNYLTAEVVLEDHRLVGLDTVRGHDQVADFLGRMRDTLSSVVVGVLHVLEHERAGLYIASMSGAVSATAPGDLAPFERLIVSLTEYDDTDLAVRWHIYDDTQVPEALARYEGARLR